MSTKVGDDVFDSIGATGKDHLSVVAWEAATPAASTAVSGQDLVAETERWIGELFDEEYDEVIVFAGATVNASYYRTLWSFDGEEPAAMIYGVAGANVRNDTGGNDWVMDCNEAHFVFAWFSIQGDSNWNFKHSLRLDGDFDKAHHLWFWNMDANSSMSGIDTNGDDVAVFRCGVSQASSNGFEMAPASGNDSWVINCSGEGDAGDTLRVIYESGAGDTWSTNNASVDCTTDFVGSFATTADPSDYNLSSDGSAPGANSVLNETPADVFENLTNGSEDLTLKSGSAAIGAGVDASGFAPFSGYTAAFTDLHGGVEQTWVRGQNVADISDVWDIGAWQTPGGPVTKRTQMRLGF